MKVFVTGGSGFVGGHTVRRLLADEHEVVAPARREQACERLRALGAVSMPLDFNDSLALQESMKGCDAVVHIAAHLKMWGPWTDFVASNVTLTEQVVRAAEALGVHRFVHVSAASGWEIATKVRLGKLPAASELLSDLPRLLAAQGFELLPITLLHGLHAGGYPVPHRDPFDRLLAAQAELSRLTLVSLDPALQAFPCCLLW